MADKSFFEVVRSQRGIRRYAPDPVPDEVVDRILQAAVWAPSGSNRQPWAFIVIRDREVKRRMGELYRAGSAAARGEDPPPAAPPSDEEWADLSEHMEDVPVLIMCCFERWDTRGGRELLVGAHLFPAVQNLLLAASALGLGTRLTTIWQHRDAEVKELLGLPENVEAIALIPLGYPGGGEHLGGSRRKSVADVTHYDRW